MREELGRSSELPVAVLVFMLSVDGGIAACPESRFGAKRGPRSLRRYEPESGSKGLAGISPRDSQPVRAPPQWRYPSRRTPVASMGKCGLRQMSFRPWAVKGSKSSRLFVAAVFTDFRDPFVGAGGGKPAFRVVGSQHGNRVRLPGLALFIRVLDRPADDFGLGHAPPGCEPLEALHGARIQREGCPVSHSGHTVMTCHNSIACQGIGNHLTHMALARRAGTTPTAAARGSGWRGPPGAWCCRSGPGPRPSTRNL